jgi:hypothetical protein
MTTARPDGEAVIVNVRRHPDIERYVIPFARLQSAKQARDAVIGTVTRAQLQPYQDAVVEAEAAVDLLFQEELLIDEAERLYGHLGASIVQAKVFRGDFNRGDDE